MTNFASILDRRPSEIEKPKPLPVGTYSTVIIGMPRYDKSAKKQTDFVEFQHKLVSAGDDVDQDDLKTALTSPDGTVKPLNDIILKNTYYTTENATWRLKDFLKDCGFGDEIEANEMSMREIIEQVTGRSVGVFIKHEPSQDGQSVFARIDRTVALD